MERILGIDYGDSRIGVAVSDLLGYTAQAVETVSNKNRKIAMARIVELIDFYAVQKVVLGLPKNMDGTLGFRAEITQDFAIQLKEQRDVQIILIDERLTTVSAIRYLNEADVRGKKRKNAVDTLAAQLILQGYLDGQRA